MLDRPLLTEVRVRMASEEFGEVGFTSEDRKLLITLAANFSNLERSVERRLLTLESERAHKDDLHRIDRDLREDLEKKADRTELAGSALMRLQKTCDEYGEKIDNIDRRLVWVYAFASGAAFLGSICAFVIAHFWR